MPRSLPRGAAARELRMLEKQTALVTGASRGIGNAIAMALAGAGATVVGTSTSAQGASAFSMSLASHGYNGRGVVLDVSNAASIDALVQDLEAAGQMPTILVTTRRSRAISCCCE